MRGSRIEFTLFDVVEGIIPAHAGLTEHDNLLRDTRRDHPRACGAHIFWLKNRKPDEGSSPRMRGSLDIFPDVCFAPGIIPAHAGLTAP